MKKLKSLIQESIFLGIFTLLFVMVSCAQTKTDKIDKLLSAYSEYGNFNGSVLVAEKGEIIYKKGFGMADMEWDIPNQANTKHRLGSITKQFTAMLIVQLASENKLDLQAPVSTYLPDYPKKNGDIITIHHLLTHTSGIPNFTSFPSYQDMQRNPYRPGEIVKFFADSALEFTPGSNFAYSNSGYILLGVLIEKITGKPYEQVLQEKILTPLKMVNTGYDHNRTNLKNRASGYERNGRTFLNANYVDMTTPFSAGALYSTVEDLYLWDQALYTDKLLPKKYMDLIFQKYIPTGERAGYGYGWFMDERPIGKSSDRIQTISHSGGINGFSTLITRMPTEKSLVVLLNNTGGAPLNDMTIAINGILHDKPYDFPKKSIAYALLDRIEKDGIDAALKFYKEVKDSNGYYMNENEINSAGYELLQSNKAREAAAVFKLNVEAYPKSFNTYDSYGEALLALGNKPEAIENYKKSVQLNPGNENGVRVLKDAGINTDALLIKYTPEYLKLLEGEYVETSRPVEWKISFDVVNGILTGNDKGYRYKLYPVGEESFINPDDGASLVFNTKDKNAITLLLFEKFTFKKVN